MAVKKTVWIGDDNTFVLTFTDVDAAGVETARDFASTYSILLTLAGSGIAEQEYTTLTVGNVIDKSMGAGQLRLRLGGIVGLAVGEYALRLREKTSVGDTAPTQLAHEADNAMKVTVKVVLP